MVCVVGCKEDPWWCVLWDVKRTPGGVWGVKRTPGGVCVCCGV